MTGGAVLIKDAVGLYTTTEEHKRLHFDGIDFINVFNVEHIVSNSYGADNNDAGNGKQESSFFLHGII